MSALMAMLFVLNLFAIVPVSASHPKDNGVTHTITTELNDLAHSQDNYQHDHVEHCGMASCTIAFSEFNPTVVDISGTKITFSVSPTMLTSLFHAPPGRPPLA
ncbi:MAG: hypothetical protein JKX94_03230 [Sneathiella sp.]|nr:hypothetical protein [Sneathiella sp.]